MKIYLGENNREVELHVYPAVKDSEVYIEAYEEDKMLEGITMEKTQWENRLEALNTIRNNLQQRFCKSEKIFKPKNYDEFVKFCEQEGFSEGSVIAKQKLKTFSANVEDFFD